MMHSGLLLLIICIYKINVYITSFTSICNDCSLSKNNGLFDDNTQEIEKTQQKKVFLVQFYIQYAYGKGNSVACHLGYGRHCQLSLGGEKRPSV